jgi:cytochrome bd-type quinol oxidase subunit 2
MDLNPSSCWDCPFPLYKALATAGVALLALWAGLRLRRITRRIARGSGLALLLLSGLAAILLSFSVSRYGIEWPGMHHPWTSPRRPGLDALFLALVLGLLAILLLRARRRAEGRDEG